jgi:hypothetical protein
MALVSTFVLYKLSSASDIKAPKFSWLKESCLYLFHDELRGLFFFFCFVDMNFYYHLALYFKILIQGVIQAKMNLYIQTSEILLYHIPVQGHDPTLLQN